MVGVEAGQPVDEPNPCFVCESRRDAAEIDFVLGRCAVRFEQQCDFRYQVRDSVAKADQLPVGQRDRQIAPTHPLISVVGFAEDVEVITAGRRVAAPGLVQAGVIANLRVGPQPPASGHIPIESDEHGGNFSKISSGDGNLDVGV